jgi:hypothetical protein
VIEVPIDTALLLEAEQMFKEAKSSDHLRFRTEKAKGNTDWTGVMGQAVFAAVLRMERLPFKFVNITQRDFEVCGLKVEVKSKVWSKAPWPSDPVSVFNYIKDHQDVDYYAFVHLQLGPGEDRNGPPSFTRFPKAYFLGVKDAKSYMAEAEEVKKGTIFDSGHEAKADSMNLAAAKLLPVTVLGGNENE